MNRQLSRFLIDLSGGHRLLAAALPLSIAAASLAVSACTLGESDDSSSGGETTTASATGCAPGEVTLADGRCQPPGLPLDMQCPPGEAPLADGSCLAAGVPPSQCGDGFAADGDGGCKAILPAEPCPFGMMAIPGESECREVAPCGSGTWGDIPIEPGTEFVDASYAGNDSNGTKEKPWKTIGTALKAAAQGDVIAIAAGTYKEDVTIEFGKKILWGRCPAMVTIEGVDPTDAPVKVYSTGAEIHNVALTGPFVGLYVDGPEDVLIDSVWVHDTGSFGVIVNTSSGAVVKGSLIERTSPAGLQAQGGSLTIERSAVREIRPIESGAQAGRFGYGVSGKLNGGLRSTVTVRSSVIERAADTGVSLVDSDATLESVAVRAMMPIEGTPSPTGIGIGTWRADVTLRRSTIEGAYVAGIHAIATEVKVEQATLSGTRLLPWDDKNGAAGIVVQQDLKSGAPSAATIVQSAFSGNDGGGVTIFHSPVLIESTLVRDNTRRYDVHYEAALQLWSSPEATIRHSLIAENQFLGLVVDSSKALFEASVVRDMKADSSTGGCVYLPPPEGPTGTNELTVRSSLFEHCTELGFFIAQSTLVIETSVVRDVLPSAEGLFGDGISVWNDIRRTATATLTGVLVESAARVGVSAFGADVIIGFSSASCNTFDLGGEKVGSYDYFYEKRGDNLCGCPAGTVACDVKHPMVEAWHE